MKKLIFVLLTLVLAGSMIVLAGCSSAAGTEKTKASAGQTTSSAVAGTTASDAAATTAAAITTAAATAAADTTAAATQKVFTLDELKTYDGQNGNPAYVAVSGIVYDVTNVKGWNNGSHQGMTAGTDLTSTIGSSPHGTSILDGITIVGTIG